jgi:alkanesulfonate monooxygenase SsuD/methylene tetrahydromethanopterin reductase-like flavin-dependent oxidoreductase (luciferase family)
MDLGLQYWNFSAPGDPQRIADTLAAVAKTAEEAGLAEFSVRDHFRLSERAIRAARPANSPEYVRDRHSPEFIRLEANSRQGTRHHP